MLVDLESELNAARDAALQQLDLIAEPVELRPYQIPPDNLSHGWLLLAGRGAGKTVASTRYLSDQAHKVPGLRARIIAPTLDDAVNSCVVDPDSGLYAFDPDARLTGGLGGTRVVWPNGSTCWLIGTPSLREVDRLRALTNIELDIFEEAAANPMLTKAVEQAGFSRRREDSRWIATTSPRAIEQIKTWVADDRVVISRASSYDNPHLPTAYREQLDSIHGTRLWRQEAMGEILLDVEGARWHYEWLDRSRVHELPEGIDQWVVAVDPASGSGTTGIVAACRAGGHLYVTDDVSVKDGTPEQWANAAVTLAEYRGAVIVAEDNQGGRMVESTIKNTGTTLPVKLRNARMSKEDRADPIALLWEKEPPTAHMVGVMPQLEDQLVTWEPYPNGKKNRDSPDRLDACLVAGTPVLTSTGDVPIEDVRAGDLVWTRAGWRPVEAVRMTAKDQKVVTIHTTMGVLTGTLDHRIWVEGTGWKELDTLVCGDRLGGWITPSKSNTEASPTNATRTASNAPTGSTTRLPEAQAALTCTATSVQTLTAPSLKDTTCTTSTVTRSTMSRRTLKLSPRRITRKFTPGQIASLLNGWSIWPTSDPLPPNGTHPRKADAGTLKTVRRRGLVVNLTRLFASNAANRQNDSSMPGSVLAPVHDAPRIENTGTNGSSHALYVGQSSGNPNTVRNPEPVPAYVLGKSDAGTADVYDIQVAEQHEFVAAGVIVHNCVWACTWLAIPDKGLVTVNPALSAIPSGTGFRGRSF